MYIIYIMYIVLYKYIIYILCTLYCVRIEKGAFYNLSIRETGTSILQQGSAET